jgi:hypothetical protein
MERKRRVWLQRTPRCDQIAKPLRHERFDAGRRCSSRKLDQWALTTPIKRNRLLGLRPRKRFLFKLASTGKADPIIVSAYDWESDTVVVDEFLSTVSRT